jgi:hypothetical protein
MYTVILLFTTAITAITTITIIITPTSQNRGRTLESSDVDKGVNDVC